MKTMKTLTVLLITIATFCISCSSDSDGNGSGNNSRKLQYQATGNFTGNFVVSYTTASGGTSNEQVTLPWNKEITFAPSVTAAIVAMSGSGGTAGQQVTLIIKRGGSQVGQPVVATAGPSGGFSISAPPVVF